MSVFLLPGQREKVVHVHIPKTGGSTIRLGIWSKSEYEGPVFGDIPFEWQPYWSFTVIRHPMLRWWSAYKDFRHIRGYAGTPDMFAAVTMSPGPWEGFDGSLETNIRHHTAPMSVHPLSSVNAIYRYPTEYESCVKDVCARAGRKSPTELPRLRETPPTTDVELSRKVERQLVDFYEEDFKEFGYVPSNKSYHAAQSDEQRRLVSSD